MATRVEEFRKALESHASEFGVELDVPSMNRLIEYYELLMKWNARLHLVGPCSPHEFAVRHVLESLLLLKHLPRNASVLDVGSGGGLPIIPCLLVRDDLRATLIESSKRKGVFLREALRAVKPTDRAALIVARFEDVPAPTAAFVTSRALDNFSKVLTELVDWAPANATFLLFSGAVLADHLRTIVASITVEHIPGSERRFLITGRR